MKRHGQQPTALCAIAPLGTAEVEHDGCHADIVTTVNLTQMRCQQVNDCADGPVATRACAQHTYMLKNH